MADDERVTDEDEQDNEPAPEVPTAFATKGVGWSGRDQVEDDDDDE